MVAVARPLSAPEMFNQLDVHVIGQDRAKKQLCSALYNHQLGLRYRLHPQSEGRTLGLHHRLLAGPTGVGKSLLIMIAGRILDVPVAWVSSTSLVETGYVGQPVESVLVALLDAAEGDLERAEQGIIMLDEFDKLRRALDVGRDVSGEGVQRGLLTLLDGRRTKIKYRERDVWIDTSRILFLAAGAFEGITTLVAQRLAREVHPTRPLGFVSKRPDPRLYSEADLWAHVLPEDIVQFGFLRELVGRFAGIITLDPLTKPDLLRLLNEAPHSPLRMKRDFFEMHGIALEFEDESLQAIVECSLARGFGARMLTTVINEAFVGLEYSVTLLAPSGVGALRFSREAIEGRVAPEMVPVDQVLNPARPRITADELRRHGPQAAQKQKQEQLKLEIRERLAAEGIHSIAPEESRIDVPDPVDDPRPEPRTESRGDSSDDASPGPHEKARPDVPDEPPLDGRDRPTLFD